MPTPTRTRAKAANNATPVSQGRAPTKLAIAILQQDHPELIAIRDTWKRVKILADGDEKNYNDPSFFFKLPAEDDAKQKAREPWYINGFVNPAQELLSMKGDYIIRRTVDRKTSSKAIENFIRKADRSGQSLQEFVKNQASPILDGYGTVFAVVDKPRGVFPSAQEEMEKGMPYLCILDPDQVKNWAWAEDGSLDFFRYTTEEPTAPGSQFTIKEKPACRYVTWTKTEYFVHDENGEEVDYVLHGFGVVPVAVQASFILSDSKTLGQSPFFTASRYLVQGNNLLSVANYEIAKYGAILMVSDQDWNPAHVTRKREPGTNKPELTSEAAKDMSIMPIQSMKERPEYLTKDIEIVVKANDQAKWYFRLAGETHASGQDAMPLDGPQGSPQSGVSKAYDFQDVDANLSAFAADLQAFELQVLGIVAAILKQQTATISVKYPESFDVASFIDKVKRVSELQKIRFPSKTGMKLAQQRITADLSTDEKDQKAINDEIEAAVDTVAEPGQGDPAAPPKPGEKKPAPGAPPTPPAKPGEKPPASGERPPAPPAPPKPGEKPPAPGPEPKKDPPSGEDETPATPPAPVSTLNGAQVEALLAVIMAFEDGKIDQVQAVAIISAAFGISEEMAAKMVGGKKPAASGAT